MLEVGLKMSNSQYSEFQILEVDLVTADGSFVTANAEGTRTRSPDGLRSTFTKNSDLFWAIRGGGGSTWSQIIYKIN